MASPDFPELTKSLLRSLSDAAIKNARELYSEAELLRDHGHMARAYFLATSSIEEAGKALLAFDSQNRNLSDPAICKKIKSSTEDHRTKTIYALIQWALASSDKTTALKTALDLIIHLNRGREPSMYSGLRSSPDRGQIPSEIVRDAAAIDCVKLALGCLENAEAHLNETIPPEYSTKQDRLLTMKNGTYREILNVEDFWWFHISRHKNGREDFAENLLEYQHQFLNKQKTFR